MNGPARALEIAMYVLVADGLAALVLGGLIGLSGAMLAGALAFATVWRDRVRVPLARRRGAEVVPALVAGALAVIDLVYVAASALDGLVHLLLFLLVYRLYTRATLRDVRDVGFIAFFMLVAAAPGTFDVGFLFVFMTFLLAGIVMLILRHLLVEAEPAPSAPHALAIAPRHVLVLSVVASVATLAITATLFFVIPRIGQAALPLRAKMGRMVSGFSDRVNLGAFGEIETDGAVAMRVHLPEGNPPIERLGHLRWRGIALDHFDGHAWRRDENVRRSVRGLAGRFDVARPGGNGVRVTQEIYLEPIGTDVLFGAPRVLGVHVRTDALIVDSGSGISVPGTAARLRYLVESEVEFAPFRRRPARPPVLEPEARERYLQLPHLDARVATLARSVTREARDPLDAGMRLERHLSSAYRYTRVLERRTDLGPVEEFLFVNRSGNCEYFAAALAVMLRSVGIPARVVNGFQRGEWNPYGRYFMVRLLDAHSWVEAFVDDLGWVTLDPSPRGGIDEATVPGSVNLYLDALRLRWYRYVVNWSLNDQLRAAGKMRRVATTWTPSFDAVRAVHDVRALAIPVLALVTVVAVVLALRHRLAVTARRARVPIPRFYARALRALARRGLAPAPGETAREFLVRVRRERGGLAEPFATITESYERVRFGGVTLTADERAAIGRSVQLLSRRGRRAGT
jgi:transglutaminase-like putative cysteine protease